MTYNQMMKKKELNETSVLQECGKELTTLKQ